MSMAGLAGSGAAKRRRERQLRAWHRHVRTTVAMELATALHHSAQRVEAPREGVEGEKDVGLRAQKAPLQGTRPGVLLDPEPQVRAATVGYVAAAGAPLLTVPSLGGGDAMDDTSVHFLLEMALLSPEEVEQLRKAERRKLAREEKERKEKERKEMEMQEMIARLTGEYLQGLSQPSSSSSPRKRKKRKKKKLPKSRLLPRCFSSLTRSSSSWRRGRSPWSSRFLTISIATVASTVVCSAPASVSRHKVEEYVLLNVCLSSFVGEDAFRAVFPCRPSWPMRFAALVVFLGCGMCLAGYTGKVLSSRCVPFGCRPAQDARHHGRYQPEGLLRGEMPFSSSFPAVACARLVLLVLLLALCSLLLSTGPDDRHHGRYGPEGQPRGVADHRYSPVFSWTRWSMPLSCRSCRFPCRWQYSAGFTGDEAPHAVIIHSRRQAQDARHHGRYGREGQSRGASLSRRRSRFSWSCFSADHRDSPVAL